MKSMATFHNFATNILMCASATLPLLLLLVATFIKSCQCYPQYEPSSISLPPSYLPKMPKSSFIAPALPPDIMPVFPSPEAGAGEPAPSSNFPTIPSSPSPPNPDDLDPNSAFAPFGAMATATSSTVSLREAKQLSLVLFSVFSVFLWWLV